jgi:hypothetical protein
LQIVKFDLDEHHDVCDHFGAKNSDHSPPTQKRLMFQGQTFSFLQRSSTKQDFLELPSLQKSIGLV